MRSFGNGQSASYLPPLQPASATDGYSGPDSFGYTYTIGLPVNWIDAAAGTNIDVTPNASVSGPIDIGFPFKFYENTYTSLHVSLFGFVTFETYQSAAQYSEIPRASSPNNLIAASWKPYDRVSGYIRYLGGGMAPNRWFVVEWNRVATDDEDGFTFELVLHENNDFTIQLGTTVFGNEGWFDCETIGFENQTGTDGLSILPSCSFPHGNQAFGVFRPLPGARLSLDQNRSDALARPGQAVLVPLAVRNTGDLGSDVFNLLPGPSVWPLQFLDGDDATPLADSNGDGLADTGSVAPVAQAALLARIEVPAEAAIGDANVVTVTIASSLSPAVSREIVLQVAVPPSFGQAIVDKSDPQMGLQVVSGGTAEAKKLTTDLYLSNGWDISTAGDGYIYGWGAGGVAYSIDYLLVDRYGRPRGSIATVVDNDLVLNEIVQDTRPSLVEAPNGMIGVTWLRERYNLEFTLRNSNVFFAVLDATGSLVHGPANLTQNDLWGGPGALSVPTFGGQRVAATTDSRFVVTLLRSLSQAAGDTRDLHYTIWDSQGGQVAPLASWTHDHPDDSVFYGRSTVLALPGERVMLIYGSSAGTQSAILNSSGSVVQGEMTIEGAGLYSNWWDAAALNGGEVVLAWAKNMWSPEDPASAISYMVLDPETSLPLNGVHRFEIPLPLGLNYEVANPSLAADAHGNAILTWPLWSAQHLYYALIGSDGSLLTPPMVIHSAAPGGAINAPGLGTGTSVAGAPPGPEVWLNHTSGAPGSYFSVQASGLPGNAPANIAIDGGVVTTTMTTDEAGELAFVLDASGARYGEHTLTISVNPTVTRTLLIGTHLPLRPLESDGPVLAFPAVAQGWTLFVPLVSAGN
jgi:hypothetical protein